MKKVKIFMALALFAFFGLFAFNNTQDTSLPVKKEIKNKGSVDMTEIKFEPKATFVKNVTTDSLNAPSDNLISKKEVINRKPNKAINIDIKPIPSYLEKSIKWLSAAQYENGGWGAGLASQQNIRDPKLVKIDPATTAFSAMALMNTGSTLESGEYSTNIEKALVLLLEMVETATDDSKNITTITGTQPQNKLGQNIDLSMTAQFLARAIPQLNKNKKLKKRTSAGLEKCVAKIENSQHNDGSWNDQGWAPVLQSAMANNALEMSGKVDGIKVKKETLNKSKMYQQQNVSASGAVATEKAAGVQLYAYSSTQRATAEDARRVVETLEEETDFKDLEAAPNAPAPEVIEEVMVMLEGKGMDEKEAEGIATAYVKNRVATKQLSNDSVLSGFGNNGGEEYLSYMMTSESMVESGEKAWSDWHQKMESRLGKVQNGDGSWSGHHCITSPVFCTAAVIMTLTADRK